MAEAAPLVLPEGSVFHGTYRIVSQIRAGGMGVVYEVVHLPTNRRRALKVMLPRLASDRDLVARFEREARVTADVESDHIVETFDAGVDRDTGAPFLAMELLRGEDLGVTLQQRGRLEAAEVVALLSQTALALERTHAAGIVHRDLKPENLFVTRRDDGSPRLKVLDFGIAKLVAQSTGSIHTTRMVGTPLYMSPEQVRGEGTIDARADVYSLGHIAYTLLVGEAYWEAEARASESVYPLLMKITHGATQTASERAAARGVVLPDAFDAWFARATATEADARFGGAREMVRELAAALGVSADALGASAPPPAIPAAPNVTAAQSEAGSTNMGASVSGAARPAARRRAQAVVAAGVVSLGAIVSVVFVMRGGGAPARESTAAAAGGSSVLAPPSTLPAIATPTQTPTSTPTPTPTSTSTPTRTPTPTASARPQPSLRPTAPAASKPLPAPAPTDPTDIRN